MDRSKLVQIIVKDLEEIRMLTEEVSVNQSDASLIIDLALNRARLLCQEIELLRDLSVQEDTVQEENEEDLVDKDEDKVSDESISDPEFEILNFEEQEFPEPEEEPDEDEVAENETEEDKPDDEEMEDNLVDDVSVEETDEDEDEDEHQDENEEVTPDEEVEENLMIESEEEDDQDEKTESEDEDEEIQTKSTDQVTELKIDFQPEVREINMDDLDEDDLEHVQFSPLSDSSDRPVMHEIPKPEDQVQEKMVVGETFQKGRSVNDVIGEQKPDESMLTNGPISSLRAAIGLNDRFLFIREIFDNKTDKYNTVIDHLDKLETIQQAVEYLKANLSLQKNDTSMKFVELLKRRFSK